MKSSFASFCLFNFILLPKNSHYKFPYLGTCTDIDIKKFKTDIDIKI